MDGWSGQVQVVVVVKTQPTVRTVGRHQILRRTDGWTTPSVGWMAKSRCRRRRLQPTAPPNLGTNRWTRPGQVVAPNQPTTRTVDHHQTLEGRDERTDNARPSQVAALQPAARTVDRQTFARPFGPPLLLLLPPPHIPTFHKPH
ncbi:hypothetical protein ml_514 [Mollivirus sibericum]|uniref:hypothetical protein n=1 Tax=Mollivirus sibericum TaxID=1678078 RepID=UPI0006B2DAEB|nr:hypothetical protein ml_10 [Mollivirus sibericum]YP_009165480.1 hypothetical protein ml_514 [Mollivirus sibericum]ALD61812.1 hypothetical protein ml_10 [Mollivirus sibericum]ALD62316.1 hypothetical protein ml_514 [Mollivirus sibericum]